MEPVSSGHVRKTSCPASRRDEQTRAGSIKKGASLGVKLAFFSWTTTMTPIDNNFLSFQLNTESKPYGIQ
ncbi:hypothetical protein MESMUL_06290 [Mesosutterella multiformis]|uniref:Uncharacterized protein n=1 Tax=Mesosutterella multiformis TaxID=2259133 RepID=A0A388SAN3_9BURK|nr:hypothetical protein MESMUL_06290 [Mesosutterella multiformis]GCB31933.1 hypothetical protein KGMB02707_12020 [Mesosutterella multiformis]